MPSTPQTPRDRIKELRRVPASMLVPHEKNWRRHPDSQRAAMSAILAEIGYADALVARELPDGRLQLIDGHLRAATTPDAIVPVIIVDVDEREASKLLATMDPLAAMAQTDRVALDMLLRDIESAAPALQDLLATTADKAGLYRDLPQTPTMPPPPQVEIVDADHVLDRATGRRTNRNDGNFDVLGIGPWLCRVQRARAMACCVALQKRWGEAPPDEAGTWLLGVIESALDIGSTEEE